MLLFKQIKVGAMNLDDLKAEQVDVNNKLQAQQGVFNQAEAELFRLGGEWRALQRLIEHLQAQPSGPVHVEVADATPPAEQPAEGDNAQ